MNRIHTVAVVGTGVIGASWTAHFLAQGLDVRATDPAPGAEQRLVTEVRRAWPILERMGLKQGASPDRLVFETTIDAACEGADFVQENGPENLEFKREVFSRLDRLLPDHVLLASSSSALSISQIQARCRYPERVVLGHPFNPPHVIPLVEVMGGDRSSEAAVESAMAFYSDIGKRPIRLRKEVKGHLANRLQAALWREAFHLVEQGVASVADVDTAIAHGPGLRWCMLGPLLTLHLSGGEGGMSRMFQHLGPTIDALWDDLGAPNLTPELQKLVVAGVAEAAQGLSPDELGTARDIAITKLLALKNASGLPS